MASASGFNQGIMGSLSFPAGTGQEICHHVDLVSDGIKEIKSISCGYIKVGSLVALDVFVGGRLMVIEGKVDPNNFVGLDAIDNNPNNLQGQGVRFIVPITNYGFWHYIFEEPITIQSGVAASIILTPAYSQGDTAGLPSSHIAFLNSSGHIKHLEGKELPPLRTL